MTQYSTVNVKSSNSQLKRLKSGIKKWYWSIFKSFIIKCDSKDETNFPQKLLWTNTQVLRLCKAFLNGLSANVKFSKIHASKMVLAV